MKERAWAVGGVGLGLGLVLVAWALMGGSALPGLGVAADAGARQRLSSDIRGVLVGIAVATVSLGIAASMRRSENWTHHVFVVLGVLLGVVAAWWAVTQLVG